MSTTRTSQVAGTDQLLREVGPRSSHGPTLRSVRRLKNLNAARDEINPHPVGLDGIRIEGYKRPRDYVLWNPNLLDAYPDLRPMRDLQERIIHDESPDATETVPLRERTVERGTVANRIIERAVVRKLRVNLDRFFADSSWGYRPRRSPEAVIQHVRAVVRRGTHWALKTDIQRFFANVDRAVLKSKLARWIDDPELIEFMMAAISPALVVRRGLTLAERTGLPEGNGITPFLANLYLHEVDQAFFGFYYYRFADDILVLGHTQQEVNKARSLLEGLLSQLGLRLNPRKTFVVDLYSTPVIFLGYELRGGNIYPPADAVRRLRIQLQSRGQEARRELMEGFVRRYRIGPVRKLFRRLDRVLHQHYPPEVTLVGLLSSMTKARSRAEASTTLTQHLSKSLRRGRNHGD